MGKPSGKHLDRSKKEVIVSGLENQLTAKEIGSLIKIDATNISREIKKRRVFKKGSFNDSSVYSDCANKKVCNKKSM